MDITLLLVEALNSFLSTETLDISSLDILSWDEVERKVENDYIYDIL